jgi:hypothetical protein
MNRMRTVRVVGVTSLALTCSALASAQQQPRPLPAKPKTEVTAGKFRKEAPATAAQGFSVVLVLGDVQGGAVVDTIPPAARKALADLKDFLPYKSYRLLDSGWILGSSHVWQRLRGPDEQEYELYLAASAPEGVDAKALRIEFTLREPEMPRPNWVSTDAETVIRARMAEQLVEERVKAEQELAAAQEKYGEQHPEVQKRRARVGDLSRQVSDMEMKARALGKRSSGQIINTSFSMDAGETVVVGTSRLRGGDKALIALLTAVPRSK